MHLKPLEDFCIPFKHQSIPSKVYKLKVHYLISFGAEEDRPLTILYVIIIWKREKYFSLCMFFIESY